MNVAYACVYCGRLVPDDCPHPNVFECCGEIGHTQEYAEEDEEPPDQFNRETNGKD